MPIIAYEQAQTLSMYNMDVEKKWVDVNTSLLVWFDDNNDYYKNDKNLWNLWQMMMMIMLITEENDDDSYYDNDDNYKSNIFGSCSSMLLSYAENLPLWSQ